MFGNYNQNVLNDGWDSKWASCFYQRKFTENDRTKYFINIYKVIMSIYPAGTKQKFDVKVRFYRNDLTFNVSFNFTTVEEVESVVEEFFVSMKMNFDHHN